MIIVTGGAGFIGSNIVKSLNQRGNDDILVVDDLTDGRKFRNLVDCKITDYMDLDEFLIKINQEQPYFTDVQAIFHQGACSSTTEWNGKYIIKNNYEYSKAVLYFCLANKVPLIYASSAAIYGNNTVFAEDPANEKPLNLYGYSKLLFDQYVRRMLPIAQSPVVGLRYFNVYGPRETHKDSMASVAFHFNEQIKKTGNVKLFAGTDGYADGEQKRDFIYVDDVVEINLWFFHTIVHMGIVKSGIFNVGTGRAQTFNEVARAVVAWHKKKKAIEYIPFPEQLKNCYQNFTQADISALRATNCDLRFKTVEQGVKQYLDWLNK